MEALTGEAGLSRGRSDGSGGSGGSGGSAVAGERIGPDLTATIGDLFEARPATENQTMTPWKKGRGGSKKKILTGGEIATLAAAKSFKP